MKFSQKFIQGAIIATSVKNDNTLSMVFRLFRVNGVFIVCGVPSSPTNTIYPLAGKESLASYRALTGYTFSYMNGFTLSDEANLATVQESKVALNKLTINTWTDFVGDLSAYNSIVGYVEEGDTESLTLQALAIKATKYGIKLQSILNQNSIAFPSFEQFSAI